MRKGTASIEVLAALSRGGSLADLLTEARRLGASDLHLVPGAPPHVRVAGELRPVREEVISGEEVARLVGELLDSVGLGEAFGRFRADRRELDCGFRVDGGGRVRANVFHAGGEVGAAFRLVPAEAPRLRDLGLPAVASQVIRRPAGFIIVTGPTGHGKSTTQAAMIRELTESASLRIITVEDPVEYEVPHGRCLVSQREVGRDTPSFGSGLRAALREDPNVLLVGEMRDLETISTALTAAETGHLVITTLHTTDAPGAIDRIVDVFPSGQQAQVRAQLAEVLLAALAQRLLPARGGRPHAHHELRGRVAACEVLLGPMAGVHATRSVIREGKTSSLYSIMETGADRGMATMEASLAALVREGLVEREVALAAAVRQEALRQLLGG